MTAKEDYRFESKKGLIFLTNSFQGKITEELREAILRIPVENRVDLSSIIDVAVTFGSLADDRVNFRWPEVDLSSLTQVQEEGAINKKKADIFMKQAFEGSFGVDLAKTMDNIPGQIKEDILFIVEQAIIFGSLQEGEIKERYKNIKW